MFEHQDALAELNQHQTLHDKLISAHQIVQKKFPFIARIALTIYDPETKILKTYLHSSKGENPLEHYSSLMDDAPSLKAILEQGKPRVINNLITFENSDHIHSQRIGRQGYAASYTMPMFNNGEFIGFIFLILMKPVSLQKTIQRKTGQTMR